MTIKVQPTKYPHVFQSSLKSPCACGKSTNNIRILIGNTREEVLADQIENCVTIALKYFKAVQDFEGARGEFAITVRSSTDPDGADSAVLKMGIAERRIQQIAQKRKELFETTGLLFQVFVNKKEI